MTPIEKLMLDNITSFEVNHKIFQRLPNGKWTALQNGGDYFYSKPEYRFYTKYCQRNDNCEWTINELVNILVDNNLYCSLCGQHWVDHKLCSQFHSTTPVPVVLTPEAAIVKQQRFQKLQDEINILKDKVLIEMEN